MDYLQARQEQIKGALAARHLTGGTLVLYDVSSAAFEGRTCPLGAIGHPKDGVRGRLQIVYGLLTSKDGVPVAIEVFVGNTGDPKIVAAQVARIKDRFAITRVVLAGDRGMLTAARLREDVAPAGLDWITALRAPQVKKLVRGGDLQLTLFDVQDLAEITAEAALDGIYVLRTSVEAGDLDSPEIVSSYKALAQVERAFRAFNTGLDIRPIRHRTETRVRAHVFLRMLSYYISWHMQARLAPMLFADDDKPAAQAARPSPVAPAARSPRALAKAAAKRTDDELPVHSFGSLLADLATICLNQIQPADPALPGFRLVTTPTPLQRRALDLLGVSHRLGVA